MRSKLRQWELVLSVCLVVYYIVYKQFGNKWLLTKDLAERLVIIPQDLVESAPKTKFDRLAYVQYATRMDYLQLAINNLSDLKVGGTHTELVVLYTKELEKDELFKTCIERANAHDIILKRVNLIANEKESEWKESLTKLHVFNLDYDRIIYFDADSMLMKKGTGAYQNLSELFNIPSDIDLAMPQAYWLNKALPVRNLDIPIDGLSSNNSGLLTLLCDKHKYDNRLNFFATHVMVIKPNKELFDDLMQYVNNPWWWKFILPHHSFKNTDYDMEIINKFADDNLKSGNLKFGVIDHRVYGVLTGEFKEEWHARFIADPQFVPFIESRLNSHWNATQVLKRIKLVHFSDEPIPKPWLPQDPLDHYNTFRIFCKYGLDDDSFHQQYPLNKPRLIEDCASAEAWDYIRKEFEDRNPVK